MLEAMERLGTSRHRPLRVARGWSSEAPPPPPPTTTTTIHPFVHPSIHPFIHSSARHTAEPHALPQLRVHVLRQVVAQSSSLDLRNPGIQRTSAGWPSKCVVDLCGSIHQLGSQTLMLFAIFQCWEDKKPTCPRKTSQWTDDLHC